MAEADLNDTPIFVDVTQGPQYSISFPQVTEQSQTYDQPEVKQIDQNVSTSVPTTSNIIISIEPVTAAGTSRSEKQNKLIGYKLDPQTDKEFPIIGYKLDRKTDKEVPIFEKVRFRCQECNRYTCNTEDKLIRHIRSVHRGENPYQCYMCEYSTYNSAVFREHIRVHTGDKPFKCSFCPYKSASKKNTKKHELRHRPDNPLKCSHPECSFIGNNSMALNKHMNIHKVKNEMDECKYCKKMFVIDQLRIHNKRKMKCDYCSEVFCLYRQKSAHILEKHGVKQKKKTHPVIFRCALCKWSSLSKPRILLHLIHHPHQEVDENHIDISILREHGIMA